MSLDFIAKTERAQFLIDNLDLHEATGYPGARWENFQLSHLQDDNTFRCEVKSRQIAWSWLTAAEAVADGLLNKTGSVFVSINLDEAKEKIRYAKNIIEALPKAMRPKLITDNRTELEFDNGARLMSLPATAPRGKAQMNVYLDEFAHVRDSTIIYTAALPMITKGNRRLRMASSPMGASGRFWEVYSQSLRPYPGYNRKSTPWWEIYAFCLNVKEARRLAPTLSTFQRVEMFGNERIKAIYANLPEEDFLQEYECGFVDETTAWITWEEIKGVQDSIECYFVSAKNELIPEIHERIAKLVDSSKKGSVEATFAAGVDIGRTRNTTEIYLVGIGTTKQYPLRLAITLDNIAFDDQLTVMLDVLSSLPIVAMQIDQNGIGRNIAESAAKYYPAKVQPVNFTNETKRLWATDAKMLIQQHKTPLPVDNDLAYQIHSIKKMITANNNLVFDTERNEKHHADKFWAWALALAGARNNRPSAASLVSFA